MDSNSKPFYKSKTLWGVLMSAAALLTMALGESGVITVSDGLSSQLTAVSYMGLGLAGYGRIAAKSALDIRPGK